MKFRSEYKIDTLAYRHFDGTLPSYLLASLCTYQTSRTLRSSKEKLLKIPKRSVNSVGDRSFSFITPTVWNSLPASLRNLPTLSDFKAQLKTFQFNRHFHKSRQTMVCVCVWGGVNYVYVCVYVCVMVCASALSFLDRKICIIQEPSIIIIIIT